MKIRALALAVLLAVPVSAAADDQPAKDASRKERLAPIAEGAAGDEKTCDCCRAEECACPLYPIHTTPGGTYYYCDYFNPDCDATPLSTFVFGDYDWPYQLCPDDCVSPARRGREPKTGLKYPVGLDYMHLVRAGEVDDLLPGQAEGQPRIPGGPARRCVRVDRALDSLFIRFDKRGETAYAKVLRFEFNRQLALGQPDQDKWRATYVAFETKEKPDEDEYDVLDAFNEQPIASSPGMFRGSFRLTPGNTTHALIFSVYKQDDE